MKKLTLVITLLISTIVAAQNKNAKAVIEVDGVCGMCKERIEKAAVKTKGVKSAVWSITTHELQLIYNALKTDLKIISQNLAEAGHDTRSIKATDEAYAKVHSCCKYRDEAVVDNHKEKKDKKTNLP